jgi:DNA-binding response OmpR family regulator
LSIDSIDKAKIAANNQGMSELHLGRPPLQLPEVRLLASQRRRPLSAGVTLDPIARVVTVDGFEVELPYLEFELLAYFLHHPWQVHSRQQLLCDVWQIEPEIATRTVDIHVSRLRQKIGRHRRDLQTVRRVGYRYAPAELRAVQTSAG